ncbi:MAG: HD domain-containing protein, partial [Spirochaetales bacterium]|nr:HD domain-containing protein [Spirochaetales bacterium]
PLLTEDEVRNLLIGKGTLNSDERKEIESHVVYTYNFLQSIPWPSDLSRIPEIAGGHHEMLDGSGYPHGLKAEDLSIECRILAILDIFDALSASDRPYKKAVPLNKVYSIMMEEGENGRLDLELLKVFFTHKIFSGIYSRDSDTIMV